MSTDKPIKLTPKQIEVLDMIHGNSGVSRHDGCFLCGRGAGRAFYNLVRKGLAYEDTPTFSNRHHGPRWETTDEGRQWLIDNWNQVIKVRKKMNLFDPTDPDCGKPQFGVRPKRPRTLHQPRPRTHAEIYGEDT